MSSVSAVASRAVVAVCDSQGVNTDAILTYAGTDRATLLDPDSRIPSSVADAIWEQAFHYAGDPRLALHAAQSLPPGAFRVLDFLAAHSPTLGESLHRISAYFRIVDSRAHLEIVDAPDFDTVRVRFEAHGGQQVPPPAQEFTFAAFVLRTPALSETSRRLAQVDFTFSAPPDASELISVFGNQIRFEQEHPQLHIHRHEWNTALAGSNPDLLEILDQHAKRLTASIVQAPSPVSERVTLHVETELSRGGHATSATLTQRLAKRCGMSERSLQRQLQDEGTTVAQLAALVRERLARQHLCNEALSLADIAFLLGFSEQSAFSRAFKRWTSHSPAQWRRLNAS